MNPGVHYSPNKTSAQAASFAAQRVFYADAALQDLEVEEWDVPGAYAPGKSDPKHSNFLRQPRRSDGTLAYSNFHYEIFNPQRGAPDAGFRWVQHLKRRVIAFGLDQAQK